jgi:phosphodiesterase/alkaline phosphatase D-like protein
LRSPSATRRCAHVEVEDLEPGRDYFYRFIVGNEDSPVGRTRTLPTVRRQDEWDSWGGYVMEALAHRGRC